MLQWRFGVVAGVYLISNVLYSLWLKNVVIVDVLLLAAGYVLRVAAGGALITVERFSPWLYICITLLALFMGFGKRRAELGLRGDPPPGGCRKWRRASTLAYLDELINNVSTATTLA